MLNLLPLDRNIVLPMLGAALVLTSCGQPPTDRELLEQLLTFEVCDSISVINVTGDDVHPFRFDEVDRFQLSGTPECLSEIITTSKDVFDCEEYPGQLACEDAEGNTAIFNVDGEKIDLTYAT